MSEYYITKAEILEWVQEIDPDVESIPNRFMTKGHTWVKRVLVNLRVYDLPSTADALGMLREAACAFILSLLCKARIITQTTGEIATDKFGDVMYQFQRTQPMFFFAQGTAKPFQELLPYETFRMMGYAYCRAYKQYYVFYKGRGLKIPKPKVVMDKTSRGNYWNEEVSYIEEDDAKYGTINAEEMGDQFNRAYEPNWVDWEE